MIKKSNPLVTGALYMVCAVFMFGLGNAMIKEACSQLTIIQLVFMRCLLSTLMMMVFFTARPKENYYKTLDIKRQLLRGGIGFASMCCLFLSFDLLPMTDATALTFATPLFISILSTPLLGERLSIGQWITIVVGFIGVAVLSAPTGNVTLIGVGAALIAAGLEGTVMIMSRQLSQSDHPLTSVFYHALVISLLSAIFVPFMWNPVSLNMFLFMTATAFVCGLGQIFVVYAYKTAPAAIVAPLLYTLIIWGGLFGYLFWGERITTPLMIGTPVVILSGLLVIYLESRKSKSVSIQEES